MSSDLPAARCLNCGEPLSGPFCGRCGQRAIPAYPTLRELVGDAWQELSGYDGRVVDWRSIMLKSLGVTMIYGIACLIGLLGTLAWASVS